MAGTSTTFNIWHAACCVYAYGHECLIGLDESFGKSGYVLSVPELDFKEIVKEYDEGTFALSSAKAFVNAFHHIRETQTAMRKRHETTWRSAAWINGVGA